MSSIINKQSFNMSRKEVNRVDHLPKHLPDVVIINKQLDDILCHITFPGMDEEISCK